jgi:hypothetical protein
MCVHTPQVQQNFNEVVEMKLQAYFQLHAGFSDQ